MASNGEAPSDCEVKIIDQVEYYFGDTNLRKDRFLKEQISENDGWVDMDTMLKFKRLNQLSSDKSVICAALRKSQSGLIEVAEDDSKIRRSASRPFEEMTEDVKKDLNRRTGYVKGFPESATLDEIQDCLARHGYAKDVVKGITMRKFLDSRKFKGSIFVELSTVDVCKKFGEEKEMRFTEDGDVLTCMTRDTYYQHKNEERREQKLQSQARTSSSDQAEAGGEEKSEQEFQKGCVLHFDGCGEKTRRETLKEIFGQFEEIAWVSFQMDDKKGEVRFTNAGGAARALEKVKEANDGKVMIDDVEATCSVLEGEAETEYWQKAREEMARVKARARSTRGRGRGGRGGRGGGRGGFKRRGDYAGAPRSKRPRTDA